MEQASSRVEGELSSWNDAYRLALGNELNGGRPWTGELHLVAIFDRALNPTEIAQNFSAAPIMVSLPSLSYNQEIAMALHEGGTSAYIPYFVETLSVGSQQVVDLNSFENAYEPTWECSSISQDMVIVDDIPKADRMDVFTHESVFTFSSSNNQFLQAVQALDQAPVPEPATVLLFGAGLVGIIIHAWRHRKRMI
jgi:hypothetical protein